MRFVLAGTPLFQTSLVRGTLDFDFPTADFILGKVKNAKRSP